MIPVIKFSETIPPQEYEKKRNGVVGLLTKMKGDYLMSLSYLNDRLKLDEKYPPAYVVSRMVDEGILDNGAFYYIDSNNKRAMTVGYKLKQ
ncbi:MAG TPA: hypothetical protein VFS97_06570 [Nitrososphaeraceae archaeon]|nr:hypothetical protein [Nitrososphaeraceae archaeon]